MNWVLGRLLEFEERSVVGQIDRREMQHVSLRTDRRHKLSRTTDGQYPTSALTHEPRPGPDTYCPSFIMCTISQRLEGLDVHLHEHKAIEEREQVVGDKKVGAYRQRDRGVSWCLVNRARAVPNTSASIECEHCLFRVIALHR